jgi:Uma2 family endonuclease
MTIYAVQSSISMEDYLEMEYSSLERHEYVNGKIRTMPYTSEAHQLIVSNIIALLSVYFRNREEKILASDRLLLVPACNKTYYPNVNIFPNEIEYRDFRSKMKVALNPLVVIEVLSESTEHVDRGEKWRCYQTIPTLLQYILVSQETMLVETFSRQSNLYDWRYNSYSEKEILIAVGECSLSLTDIYHKVVFAGQKTDEVIE